MEKKYEDDELDQLINEQFINEAQIMEEALFSDDDTEDYEASDEEIKASYQQLVDRLKAEGVYREDGKDRGDTDRNGCGDTCRNNRGDMDVFNASVKNTTTIPGIENTNNMSEKTDKVISVPETKKRFNAHKVGKVAGIIVVSGLCVFVASMTSEANRNYFVKNIKYLTGDRTKVVVDNDQKNEKVNVSEYEAVANIEEELGIDVPEFFYHPIEFYKYTVANNLKYAKIEYKYQDFILELRMTKTDEETLSFFDSVHGDNIETIKLEKENLDIEIKEVKDEQDTEPSYVACWKTEDVYYSILGKMELNELIKMLMSMKFYT